MRNWIFILAIVVLSSCGAKKADDETAIRDQIAAYKKEIAALNMKVSDLEKQLLVLDTSINNNAIPVEVLDLAFMPFKHYIEVSGSAEAVKAAYISPEMGGQIRDIYVKEGDYVEKGKLLARLNTDITESSIKELESALALADTVFQKQQRLWNQGIGSEIQYLNAKNAKESLEQKLVTANAQLDMSLIKAPISGIVDNINQKKGELAAPGMMLMQIVNLDEMYINADVSETYLPQVKEGAEVRVQFPVYPDKTLQTPIYRKGNVINPSNRTFQIQLRLSNPDKQLKPNLLAVVQINDFSSDTAIIVPSILIKQDITGYYVFTAQKADGRWIAKKVYIQPGKSYIDKTMVLSGLSQGEKVITKGYNMVSDGSEIAVKQNNVS
jgi:membrane fusion protein, multidrug efflux system